MGAQPALRVYHGPPEARSDTASDDRAEPSIHWTLIDFWVGYVKPYCLGATVSPRTIKQYEIALWRWYQLTGDPRLSVFRDPRAAKRICARFVAAALQIAAVETVRKWCRHLNYLLHRTGPAGWRNEDGADLLDRTPHIKPPRPEWKPPPPPYSLEEIWRLLEIARVHAKPLPEMHGYRPAVWWQALILLAYNTGLRPMTLMVVRWEQLRGQTLVVTPGQIKGGRGMIGWINRPALTAISALKRPSGPILAWSDWPKAATTLRTEWNRFLDLARLPHLSLYGLRRAFSTHCAKIDSLACQIMMNHTGPDTRMLREHYLDIEEVLRNALERMPQPAPATQQDLF